MKPTKYCLTLAKMSVLASLSSAAIANDLPASISESYISLGVEHEQSDNISKVGTGAHSGNEQTVDVGVGYFNQTATNFTALDYSIYYTHYSDDDLDNESDISGSLDIRQEVFSKNVLLNLSHFRRSYLLNQNGSDVPDNTGDRDVFTISPVWIIPYSGRAGFQTNYSYTATRYTENGDQDTDRNGVGLSWYNNINAKTRFDLSSQYSKVEYNSEGDHYNQITTDASINGKLLAGTYLVKAGYSRIMANGDFEGGAIFELGYDYQFSKHNISFSLQRELTDSSYGLGEDLPDNDLEDYDGSDVLWIDRAQLQHRFDITNRLSNTNRLYYQQETEVISDDQSPRWGIATAFNFRNTSKISSFISFDYSESSTDSSFDKQVMNTTIGGNYQFRPRLNFSLQANYEDQSTIEEISSYDEMRYTARIEYKY
jgi:hypothetical protein